MQQTAVLEANPAALGYLTPLASYTLQIGWMEPVNLLSHPLFRGAYLEAQGNAMVSPVVSDIGMAFNLRPLRFIEGGVAYNRLLFPGTLLGFAAPSDNGGMLPEPASWRADQILDHRKDGGVGADAFTFQANVTANLKGVQLHGGGFRTLWDVDVKDHELLLEYQSGLLIYKRDRVNSLYAQILLNLDHSVWGFTARGLAARQQYWWVTRTELTQYLVSAGVSGLRRGHNDTRLYRGLDLFAGYWLDHPQFGGQDGLKRLQLSLKGIWNIQFLGLSQD